MYSLIILEAEKIITESVCDIANWGYYFQTDTSENGHVHLKKKKLHDFIEHSLALEVSFLPGQIS